MTISISLEQFYDNLDKHIKLASSFTEKEGLDKIIMMCRLKPYDLVHGQYTENLILYHRWFDEYGNSLIINKDKKIKIRLNDLIIDRDGLVSTDLYGQLLMENVSTISKLLFFFYGKEEDEYSPHTILSFLGIDNYLRTFVLVYGEWKPYPSLSLGMGVLSEIANNYNLQEFKEIKPPKQVIYPCDSQRAWLSSWPPSKDFVSIMNDQNESVSVLLNITKENSVLGLHHSK